MSDVIKLPKLKTRQEAAAYLGVSVFTLNSWASTGRIKLPFYKVGRRTMYKESDLLAFLEANKQQTQPTGGDAA
ncbi:helix-turn-helix domain-containing protein [Vogesella indigofera]|uniref:Helix-turn-helix domain-containing protein n=1 Tax=Vogesella indigofera TaxID=45465 RepID=A0ABT5I6J1_VOGIN|nr:helix-turn-helix domain-containing protein [Vogesella indigofera]MDC7691724.1 helix-turn-helix domain-containing protein [Vogesella indigofera]